ncbi:hypothetical protein M2169_006035 [Streptomyces sp. MJP52]|nr:hypothetical protein [Streptomyces sp. MJP52]
MRAPSSHRHGVLAPAAASAILPVLSGGDTDALVPLFAIGVFVALPMLVAAFETVHRAYARIGERLDPGASPRGQPPARATEVSVFGASGSVQQRTSDACLLRRLEVATTN